MSETQMFMALSKLSLDFEPRCLLELSTIKESITEYGITVPIPVVKRDGRFWVKARELFFLAARELGVRQLPVSLIEDEREHDRLLLASLLSPVDNSLDVARRIRHWQERYHVNQTQLGREFGVSQSLVSKYMRLLEYLYSTTIEIYVRDLRVADRSRNHRDNPCSRQGAADVGLRHLLELTRTHHKYSGLSPQRSEQLQSRLMGQMTSKCPSVAGLKRKIKDMVQRRSPEPAVSINDVPRIRVYNADARHLLQVIPRDSVNLVVTSPSYNLQKPYESWKSFAEHLETITPPVAVCRVGACSKWMVFPQCH